MKAQRGRQIQRIVLFFFLLLAAIVLAGLCIRFCLSSIQHIKQQSTSICNNNPKWYTQPSTDFSCPVGSKQLQQRLKLLADLSYALNKTSGLHWLCYGTLWGVIRGNTLLDYDRDGDICTIDISQGQIERAIISVPGNIRYIQNFTSFHIWRDLAEVEITSFVLSNIMNDNTDEYLIVREGYRNPLVSRSCIPESFPNSFIKPPLSYKLLDGIYFPVPKDNYEIQMYIYPDDWHQTVKPLGCR